MGQAATTDTPSVHDRAMGKLLSIWPHHAEPAAGEGPTGVHRLRVAPRAMPPAPPQPQPQVLPNTGQAHAELAGGEGEAGQHGGRGVSGLALNSRETN